MRFKYDPEIHIKSSEVAKKIYRSLDHTAKVLRGAVAENKVTRVTKGIFLRDTQMERFIFNFNEGRK